MKNLQQDFKAFAEADHAPPPELSARILATAQHELNPSAMRVFLKVLAVHSLTSLWTLGLCPQFGFRLYGSGLGLMRYFMRFGGNTGCMVACGIIFVGLTSFASALVLKRAEVTRLLREWPVHTFLLVGFSLAFFLSVDAYLSLFTVLWWTAGGFIGAYVSLQGGLLLRKLYAA